MSTIDKMFQALHESDNSSKIFDYTSDEFTSVKDMNYQKEKLISELVNFLGVDRKSFRLQRGNIMLQALTDEGNWINVTSTITAFATRIRTFSANSFRLRTKLAVK